MTFAPNGNIILGAMPRYGKRQTAATRRMMGVNGVVKTQILENNYEILRNMCILY